MDNIQFEPRLSPEYEPRYTPKEVIKLLLDHIDYTGDACGVHECIGAILPKTILEIAKKAVNR